MQLEGKLIRCHLNFFPQIEELDIKGGEFTISLVHSTDSELGIYLGKDTDNGLFEVKVLKTDKHDELNVPDGSAFNIVKVGINGCYTSFFFENFDVAHEFVNFIIECNPELLNR